MKRLLTFFFCVSIVLTAWGTEYTIGGGGTTYSNQVNQVPIAIGPMMSYSFTQQLYLASELTTAGASAGSIESISFTYEGSTSLNNATRTIEVWMRNVSISAFSSNYGYGKSNTDKSAGTLCYSGYVTIPTTAHESYTITLDSPFEWDGHSNIIVTLNDKTGTVAHNYARYHKTYAATNRGVYATNSSSVYNAADAYNISITKASYIPVITFSFAAASSVLEPTSPTATGIERFSATLGWTAAAGADSYEVRYGTSSGSLGDATNVGNVTSYELSGLEESTTYYYQIRTKKGDDYSDWTAEANFTTLNHTHNTITFNKWNYSGTLPIEAGNYYLAHDVTLSTDWDPGENINLCLNGHTVNMGSSYGLINGNITVAIYDEEAGEGKITSSNSTQTLLASGNFTNLFVYANIENTGGGRAIIAANGATASKDAPIALLESANNAALLAENEGIMINAAMTRSFTSAQYNTICLPFEVSNATLQYMFGSGYDLEEFDHASFDGDELSLSFNKVTSLTAGKPYLLKPAISVTNPTFEGVTIGATAPADQTSDTYISFHGVFSPTSLEGGNKNILFLGANDELFWPASTGNLKGFRAYFEVKGEARKAARARAVFGGHEVPTGVESVQMSDISSQKIFRDGKLIIVRDGVEYDVLGQRVK